MVTTGILPSRDTCTSLYVVGEGRKQDAEASPARIKFKGSEYLNPAHQSHLIITEMELHYATHTKSCCSVMFKYSDPLNSAVLGEERG